MKSVKATYEDIVSILAVTQDRNDRGERYESFLRAIDFYKSVWPFDFPDNGRGVVLIAGTNGKGSVAKTLETLLGSGVGTVGSSAEPRGSGSVGLFTSPHLMEPTERIRSGGRDLAPLEMVRLWEMVEPTVSKFELSHFEILTLMMIETFFGNRVRPRVSWAVIEVGVGGRLDPTRVVPHETAVVTSIALDHEAILGSTLEAIAREKLAIAHGARRLVVSPQVVGAAPLAFADVGRGSSLLEVQVARVFESSVVIGGVGDGAGVLRRPAAAEVDDVASSTSSAPVNGVGRPTWVLHSPWGDARLAMLGARAVHNTSLAIEVFSALGFSAAASLPSLSRVVWPGRMEPMTFGGRTIYLSGDHNEQGVESLIELLGAFSYDRLWLVVGVGKGKPLEAMLGRYLSAARVSVVLTLTSFRTLSVDDLVPWASRVHAIVPDPMEALRSVVELAGPRDLVVVSGSLYLVGDLRARILGGA